MLGNLTYVAPPDEEGKHFLFLAIIIISKSHQIILEKNGKQKHIL